MGTEIAPIKKRKAAEDLQVVVVSNGDFARNYGRVLGAFLYLRSAELAAGRPSFFRAGWIITLATIIGGFAVKLLA